MIISGMAKLMIGDLENSLAAFKQAYSLKPNAISSCNSLGMVYLRLGKYEQSKLYFTKALDINTKNFAARNNLGLTHLKLHDYKSAESNFRIALEEKKDPTVYSNLAFCLFELNSVPEAIKNWEKSIDLFSRRPSYPGMEFDQTDAKAGLSIGYFVNGNHQKAINLYKSALERNPDYAVIAKLENEYFWPPRARSTAIELINKIKSNPQ
jgi:tetratricopeptide (TPR) repeat protein